METPPTPETSGARRDAALRRAAIVLAVLVPCLWGVTFWLKSTKDYDPCGQVKICDAAAFKEACEGAATTYPEVESAVAVIGHVIEERCPESAATCEVDLLGGPGPVEDGCVIVYERGTGRIIESRWHSLPK